MATHYMRKYPASKYDTHQRIWCREYERHTTFEPLMDDYDAGNESFVEAAKKSIQWFNDWALETARAIENIPGC